VVGFEAGHQSLEGALEFYLPQLCEPWLIVTYLFSDGVCVGKQTVFQTKQET